MGKPDLLEWARRHRRKNVGGFSAMAVARKSCQICHGEGQRTCSNGELGEICSCVWRKVFRSCYGRYRACAALGDSLGTRAHAERTREGAYVRGFKGVEYMADFQLVARRSLREREFQVFRMYHLWQSPWSLCVRQLGVDRGTFFHLVYRVEEKLGRAYATLEPYGLMPAAYFGGHYVQTAQISLQRALRLPVGVSPRRDGIPARYLQFPESRWAGAGPRQQKAAA